jgi:hypothetical protein
LQIVTFGSGELGYGCVIPPPDTTPATVVTIERQ